MKKLLLIILVATIFFGCSKKDDGMATNMGSIIGKWTIVSDTIINYSNGNLQYVALNTIGPGSYIQFNTNRSGVQFYTAYNTYVAYTYNFTYSISGDTATLNYPAQSILGMAQVAQTSKYAITLTNNQLIMHFGNGTFNGITQINYYSK